MEHGKPLAARPFPRRDEAKASSLGERIVTLKYEEREATYKGCQAFEVKKRDLLERQKSDYFPNIHFGVNLGLFGVTLVGYPNPNLDMPNF
jgi:hypothetical protein